MDTLEVYRSLRGKGWRWRYRAVNGEKMATSGESYHNKQDCLEAAARVLNLPWPREWVIDGAVFQRGGYPAIQLSVLS